MTESYRDDKQLKNIEEPKNMYAELLFYNFIQVWEFDFFYITEKGEGTISFLAGDSDIYPIIVKHDKEKDNAVIEVGDCDIYEYDIQEFDNELDMALLLNLLKTHGILSTCGHIRHHSEHEMYQLAQKKLGFTKDQFCKAFDNIFEILLWEKVYQQGNEERVSTRGLSFAPTPEVSKKIESEKNDI